MQRSLVALVSVGLVTGGVLGWISYQESRSLIEQAQERARMALARGLALGLADQLAIDDYAGMESRLEQAMTDETIASALVVDTEGKVLVHLQRRRPSDVPELVFVPQRILPPRSGLESPVTTNGITTRWSPIVAGLPVGWLKLRTWSSSTDAVLRLLAQQYLVLGSLTAALVGTLLVSGNRQMRRQAQLREQQLNDEKVDLERIALTDPLTGLYNRRGIERALLETMQNPASRATAALAVCMIDLDDFKTVNDVHGHGIGDLLLTAVAQRLRSYLREGDCVGRIGGDEFIAVFRGCSERELALTLAQRISDGLNQPFRLGDHLIRIGASIGVVLDAEQSLVPNLCEHPSDAASNASSCLESLVKLADRAMYLVKQNGKRQVAIAPKGF
ncbi:diguanylate cyclase [Synechococcus sp. CBW1108]|uniref:GGDEF domain-containing protein n=1 Tax=Synechococcus sp. CBW1108 TaxID=1353147 RepID=UPI0018CC90BE|nr:diguanylate cyclase [Synechococcus sp. CBW1108]QPN69834.1 diguanylate cyclase [Synechococcus sp. CBW1108]